MVGSNLIVLFRQVLPVVCPKLSSKVKFACDKKQAEKSLRLYSITKLGCPHF